MNSLSRIYPILREETFSGTLSIYISIALLATLISGLLSIATVLVLILIYSLLMKRSGLILVPFLLIVFITDLNAELRLLIIGFSFILLIYELIEKYGFIFSDYPKLPTPILISMASLIVAMLISTLTSNYLLLGFNQLLRVIGFFIFIYLFSANINSREQIDDVINSLILAGMFLGGTVLVDLIKSGFSIFNFVESIIIRIGGFYSNVNAVSVPIFVSVILLYYKIQIAKSDSKKVTFILLFVTSLIFLLINNSRSAIIASVIALFVILYFRNKKKFHVSLTAAILILPLLYFFTPFGELIDFYFRMERLTSGREVWWQMATDMFYDSPFFGVGPASFKYEMYKFLPIQLGSWEELGIRELFYLTDFGIQHNFILFISSELGLLGLAAVIVLVSSFLKSYFLSRSNSNSKTELDILSYSLLAIGMGFFGRAQFESINIFSYGWLTGDLPFWLIFLIICKINQLNNPNENR